MTENEALKILNNECEDISKVQIALKVAREALEEIQQYRAIGTVEEVKYLVDSYNGMIHDFGDDMSALEQYRAIGTVEQLERCKDASHWKELFKEKLEQYEAIGTVEEFKTLKDIDEDLRLKYCYEDLSNAEHRGYCQGSNEAVDDFAKFLHDKAKENNGLRLSSETRSWTHLSIFDYLEEFKSKQICKEEVDCESEE